MTHEEATMRGQVGEVARRRWAGLGRRGRHEEAARRRWRGSEEEVGRQ